MFRASPIHGASSCASGSRKRSLGFTLIEVLVTLVVISVGALAVMKFANETQDLAAEITHLDTMSRLTVLQMSELEREGFSSATSKDGDFEDYPGYTWSAESSLLRTGGWYRMTLVVTRTDTGRTVKAERIFREQL